MIRYILVDDMPQTLEDVKTEIDTISKHYDLQHVKSYNSSKKAYEDVNEDDFDLLIVDFEMPVFNGVELAKKIGTHKKIIFLTSTTNNEQQVIKSIDISGYLSKPFDIEEFEEILKHKIIGKLSPTRIHSNEELITIHIGTNKDIRFTTDQVYYISTSRTRNGEQPDKNCVHFYGKQDEILFKNVRKSINDLSIALTNYNFEKINQSTIINMAQIKERDNTNISLFNSKETFEITAKEKLSFVAKLRARLKV